MIEFAGGLKLGENLQVAMELAVGGIDAALQKLELLECKDVSRNQGIASDGILQAHVPGDGFESSEAGQEPGMIDEVGDQGFLFGTAGMEAVEVVVAKGFEG